MKNMILAILVLIPLMAFSNENSGVKETNYQVGLHYYENRDDNLDNWNNTLLSASITFPIYKYIGSRIGVSGYKSGTIRYPDSDFSSKTSSYSMHGSLFLRDKDIGKIGATIGYEKSKTDFDDGSNNNFQVELKSNTYSIYGSYYFNDFTFSGNRFIHDLDNDDKINICTIGVSYYINDNTMLSTSHMSMDSMNNYNIAISHQPYFFNNSTETGISYDNNKGNSSVSFFVSYYFGIKVPLKIRNREYR